MKCKCHNADRCPDQASRQAKALRMQITQPEVREAWNNVIDNGVPEPPPRAELQQFIPPISRDRFPLAKAPELLGPYRPSDWHPPLDAPLLKAWGGDPDAQKKLVARTEEQHTTMPAHVRTEHQGD